METHYALDQYNVLVLQPFSDGCECESVLSIRCRQYKTRGSVSQKENDMKWAASSEFGTYRLCEQRRFRRACASVQSRQNLRCSLIQAVSQEEPSDKKPDPWPLWMAGHAQLKFVMTECSKTQIRLTGLKYGIALQLLCWYCLFLSSINPWWHFILRLIPLLP